jgi:hypothetical protein
MLAYKNVNDAYFRLILGKQEDMSKEFTPKPDTGTLFKNGFKANPSQPDYRGNYAMPDGTVRDVAAWLNEKGYISIRFSDQYEATQKKSA